MTEQVAFTFQQLRKDGLQAYRALYEDRHTDALEHLPPPELEIPISVVASLAHHADEFTGERVEPLRGWIDAHVDELSWLVPEAFGSGRLWEELWRPEVESFRLLREVIGREPAVAGKADGFL